MEKKKYTVLQNISFYFKEVKQLDKHAKLRMAYYALITVMTSLVPAVIPSIILSLVIQNRDLLSMGTQIILASLASGLFIYLQSRVQITKLMGAIEIRISFFGYKMYHKFLTADYEMLTQSDAFNAYKQAMRNAIDSNSSGTEALYIQLIDFFSSILGISIFTGIMLFYSPIIVLLVFVSALINIAAQSLPRSYREKHRDDWGKLDSMLHQTKNEVIKPENGKDIRIFNVAPLYMEKVNHAVDGRMDYIRSESNRVLLSDIITIVTKLVRDGYTYIFLIKSVFNGMSLPQFSFLFNLMSILDAWVTQLVKAIHSMTIASQDIDDLRHFLSMDLDQEIAPKTLTNEDSLKIEFKNVYFKYETQTDWVLDDVSFVINPNEKMALVGVNGAGKSTLVNLMMGLITPTKGSILVNDVPIRDLDYETRTKLFAPVFQENEIWALTTLQNITLSKAENVDIDHVYDILDSLGLKEKIESLPNQLNTPLTRNLEPTGVELSGGESQKLMLARALYKNSGVLVLDEPTAALDAIAEQALYEEYATFAKDKTSLFISHRLSSTRFCDRITVLDGGKIAECGTHEELMKLNNVYAEMFNIQSQYYRKENEDEVIL